jgi:hypothetical protein
MRKKYKVSVYGCDDTTTVIVELTEEEYAHIKDIAAKVTEASTYCCMPTMDVTSVGT